MHLGKFLRLKEDMDSNLAPYCDAPADHIDHVPYLAGVCHTWQWVLDVSPHFNLIARAAAAGVFPSEGGDGAAARAPGESPPYDESLFERAWTRQHLRGEVVTPSCEDMEETLEAAIEASGAAEGPDADKVLHPERHPEILRDIMEAAWVRGDGDRPRWPIQRLVTRILDRDRFAAFWDELPDDEARVRVRGYHSPMCSIPYRAIPSTATATMDGAQFTWMVRSRLGVPQAATEHLEGGDCGSCKKPWGDGHHARVCKLGGGVQAVHDALVSTVWRMARAAGLPARIEPPHLVTGTTARPADVRIVGLAGPGGDDTAVDVVVYDNRTDRGQSNSVRAKMLTDPSCAAVRAEGNKRRRKIRDTDVTVEDFLRARRIHFAPLGFTVAGAPGATWSNLLKKISDHASSRKGHHEGYFRRRWETEVAMVLAKRGAEAALRRARAATVPNVAPDAVGVFQDPAAEPVLVMGNHDDDYPT